MKNEAKKPLILDERRFGLGQVVVTRAALFVLSIAEMCSALKRHSRGDWGDVGSEDWESNDFALSAGERLLSVYQSSAQEVFWIITEWDRKSTTILLPSDY